VGDLSYHFSRSEFACKCGCGLDAIDRDLVDNLEQSRTRVGIGYPINCGCRCESHNKLVGGKDHSAHLPFTDGLCHAADLECSNSHEMFIMVIDLIRRFRRIELGKTSKGNLWIHVDNRRDLLQEVIILEVREI